VTLGPNLSCDFRQFRPEPSFQVSMGTLIDLQERLADRSRPTRSARPAFFFDLSCPYSYLVSERVERRLGAVDWIPAARSRLRGGHQELGASQDREYAEQFAERLRLPLVWPERFPAEFPRALRAASYACETGAGSQFALAAARLAFCGGFDLEDPEVLAEAAAAACVPLDACLQQAGNPGRDAQLLATGDGLRRRGVQRLPGIRIGPRWFAGEHGLFAACATLRSPAADATLRSPAERVTQLAPVS
jgi:2-hydroxychromene-2-carboxylate isomerase